MRVTKPKVDDTIVLIPNERYEDVKRRVEKVRLNEEFYRLEFDCEKLREELAVEYGNIISRDDLVPGRRYAVLGFSITANSVRRGTVLPHTGEIYLYLWTYYKDGVFRQEDAWGGIHESRLPGSPLIEL